MLGTKRLFGLIAFVLLAFVAVAHTIPENKTVERLMQKADSLYRMGHFESAVEIYIKAAEEGNAEAQFDIGYAYFNGEGIQRDYTSAAMWFKRAARQNFAKAQYNLAYCYMNGRGVPRDYDKAFDYLKLSAENNYKRAQLTLADCYIKGVLVEQNDALGKQWKEKADAKGTTVNVDAGEENKAKQKELCKKNDTTVKKETLEGDFSVDVNIPGLQNGNDVLKVGAMQQKNVVDNILSGETKDSKLEAVDSIVKPNVILGPNHLSKQKEQNGQPKSSEVQKDKVQSQEISQTIQSTATNAAPVLKILYPEDQSLFHTDQVKLKYQLLAGECKDSTRVIVMVDGQRQPTTRAVRAANTIDVDLPHHDCTVMMYAQNKNGNSEPATIRLIRETSSYELPKLFVVAIGIGDYNDPKLPKLKFTCKDAQDFAKSIATKKGLPYEDVQVKVLCDSEATRADIFEAMEWLKQESSPNDVCVFFYAGHGLRDEKDRFYFMPYGCSSSKLYECFSASDFRNEAEDINGKLIVFVDACYSGALFEGGRSAATSHFVEQLKRSKNGMLLYASSSSDTKSREDESWGNGAFTKALVEAMNGAAKEEHAEGLSTQELEHFLYKEVRKLTEFKQTPIFINPNGIEHFNIFNYEK